MTDKEIAKALSISIGTVITLWSTIRGKLGISSRAAAVAGIAWAVAKLESRNVPEVDEPAYLFDNQAVEPAILILGKQQVVLMCNAVAAIMFDVVPGMTLDKSPKLARALTDNTDPDSEGAIGFPWSRAGAQSLPIEEVIQIASAGGSTQQVVVSCTFADDHVFGRVAILRVHPTNNYAVTDRRTNEGPFQGKDSSRWGAAVPIEKSPVERAPEPETKPTNPPMLRESPFILGRVEDVPQFAAMISHDLEGPLRAISCISQMLAADHAYALTNEGKRFLDQIQARAIHLVKLLDGIAEYAQIDDVTRWTAPVDLASFARDLAREVEEKTGIKVQVDVDSFTCETDPEALGVCVRMLLENAAKSASATGEPLVGIRIRKTEDRCQIAVWDNGENFDTSVVDVFEAIDRRVPRSMPAPGVGITLLSLAAARLGGFIAPESLPGQRATFTLDIPCRAIAAR